MTYETWLEVGVNGPWPRDRRPPIANWVSLNATDVRGCPP